jgi:C4-dicarboxylate-specific signal transduction histidine kinase
LGVLTASIALVFNQPISGVVTNASACLRWLANETPDLEKAKAAATRIVRDGTRAAEIISRIRLIFTKGSPQRHLVDINQLARETVDLLSNEAARHSVSIRMDLTADIPQVMADSVRLQQVVVNLIVNGIEAMKDVAGARELVLKSMRSGDEHVMVSVSDTGVGLGLQPTEDMFNAFFTTKPDGTGLGLSISRSIVEAHRGRLWATPNTHKGAIFQFTLAVHDETSAEWAASSPG